MQIKVSLHMLTMLDIILDCLESMLASLEDSSYLFHTSARTGAAKS